MRLFTQTIAFMLALRAAAVVASSSAACKMLSDKDSAFILSVAQLNGLSPEFLAGIPLEQVFGPVDSDFPWFSKCIANVNLVDVVMAVSTSPEVGQCLQALDASSELLSPSYAELSDAFFSDALCPVVVDTAVPCLNDVFLPVLAQALSSAGGCCSDMNAVITGSFGANLQQLTATLSKLVANALCSVKTTTNSDDVGLSSETCGYSLLSNFLGQAGSDMELLMALAAAVQIPEDSVCSAVEGEPFRTTTGGSAEFGGLPGGQPYGICYATMQSLVSYVKSFPVWSALTVETDAAPWLQQLSDLFAPNTCVRGDYLLQWALDDDSVVTKALDLIDRLDAATSASPERPSSGSSAGDAGIWSSRSSPSDSASEEEEEEEEEEGDAGQETPATSATASSAASGSSSRSHAAVSFLDLSRALLEGNAGDDAGYDAGSPVGGPYSTAAAVRESLSWFEQPLAAVCVHFPSVNSCDFGEEELALAFGRSVAAAAAPAKAPAADGSSSKTTTTDAATDTPTPEPTAPSGPSGPTPAASASLGDASAASALPRPSGAAASLAAALSILAAAITLA